MILKTHDLNKNIDAKIFLFHGINEGQKEEIIEKIFKPIFGENVFKYYEKEIFSDIENFYNQILSKSFFSNIIGVSNLVSESVELPFRSLPSFLSFFSGSKLLFDDFI